MADKYFQCPDGDQGTATVVKQDGTVADVPACTQGAGSWIDVPLPWWSYQIPQDQVAALFGVMALLWAVVWVGRQAERSIES